MFESLTPHELEALEALIDRRVRAAHSRRWLLTAGAGVAAAGVGAVLAAPEQASAAVGGSLLLGEANDAVGNSTSLTSSVPGTTGPALDVAMTASTANTAIRGISGASSGLISTVDSTVVGDTNLINATGVAGASARSFGVVGVSNSGAQSGVYGNNRSSGPGVIGASFSGVDVAAQGTGRFYQSTTLVPGAPNASGATYSIGEQARDSTGQMWICIANGTGAGAVWQKVVAAAPGANGGSINMLPSPFRLYDSRAGQPSAITTPKQQLQSGSANALQLTATGQGGIPTGAIGIVGTVTITNSNGAGYLALYPGGGAVPPTSNVNWTATNQTVAASYLCALSPVGSVSIDNGGSGPTDVILDIAGYIY